MGRAQVGSLSVPCKFTVVKKGLVFETNDFQPYEIFTLLHGVHHMFKFFIEIKINIKIIFKKDNNTLTQLALLL